MPLITLLAGAVVGTAFLLASMLSTTSSAARIAVAPASAAAPATAAPSGATAAVTPNLPAKAHYSGEVDGGYLSVSIWVRGGHASAYLCNGSVIEAWYSGPAIAGQLDLTGKHGDRLKARYDFARATGYVTVSGHRYPFSAPWWHKR